MNTVLLEHSHDHSFTYGPWLLFCYSVRVERLHTEHMGHKVQNINYWGFIEKFCWPLVWNVLKCLFFEKDIISISALLVLRLVVIQNFYKELAL